MKITGCVEVYQTAEGGLDFARSFAKLPNTEYLLYLVLQDPALSGSINTSKAISFCVETATVAKALSPDPYRLAGDHVPLTTTGGLSNSTIHLHFHQLWGNDSITRLGHCEGRNAPTGNHV